MPQFYFTLHISPDEYLRHYRGAAATVLVRDREGRRLSFPAANLRRFVLSDGIHGDFRLTVDEQHRLLSLERCPNFQGARLA